MGTFQCTITYWAVQLVTMSKDLQTVPGFNSTTYLSYLCVSFFPSVKRKY